MKRIICLLLTAALLLNFTGCQKKEEGPKYPDRDVELATEIPKLNEDSLQIHYQRKDNSYASWALWLWDPDGQDDNKEDDFNYQDDFGVIASYPLSYFGDISGGRLGMIIKSKGSWNKKDGTDSDRYINFSSLTKDENGVYHVYLVGGDAKIYTSPDLTISDAIAQASFTDESSIYIAVSNAAEAYRLYCDGEKVVENKGSGRTIISEKLDFKADFTRSYEVEVDFRASGVTLRKEVSVTGLYNSESFNEMYFYDGPLGALYTADKTVFKVWSPVSTQIELRIYESGTPKSVAASGNDAYTAYPMEKGEKGVFSAEVSGDLAGKYYTYFVINSKYPDGREIVDPYARSAGVNGVRGMIVDFSKANPDGWDKVSYLKYDRKSLTVWETHVADVTSSATWTGSEANRRKYLGVVEEGTTYSENGVTVTTGFDHIKELGVNAVQLIPVFDQANDETKYVFNWGYNPLNYNVPEGMYSSDPYDGYARIRELKTVIQKFNEAGITVIMDVVYNHVNGVEGSNFDTLMPGYYFRYNQNGSLSNGSGCGNETASEYPMVRKFIIDSICFWTQEYKLGGFRFDLMGLHDVETMNLVAEAARKINPNIVIYGEPWTGGGTTLPEGQQAKQVNANDFVGYGQFNDQMRDALIKGGLNGPAEKGWVTGTANARADVTAITKGINGITYNINYEIADPDKTVNYVTCHDNYTLYDRVVASGTTDEETIRKMAMLANAVVFTSRGTTFMLAGEEMLRTKKGDSNSYMSSDEINNLDYSLKIRNLDIFENYRKLISFRQNCPQLCGSDGEIIVEVLDNSGVLKYTVGNYLIIHGNGTAGNSEIATEGYSVVIDTAGVYEGSVSSVKIAPYQSVILQKN